MKTDDEILAVRTTGETGQPEMPPPPVDSADARILSDQSRNPDLLDMQDFARQVCGMPKMLKGGL